MAIIKCPECGHQISDKAPTCPNCGVEIAHKVTRCPECGEVYFKDELACPSCHHANNMSAVRQQAAGTPTPATVQQRGDAGTTPKDTAEHENRRPMPAADLQKASSQGGTPDNGTPKKKKTNWTALIVSFIVALLVCGVCFYMYKNAQDNKELQEYEFAAKSNDPLVLQSYLDTYKDAPQTHIDAISNHLRQIQEEAQEWTNAWVSNSKTILEDYLRKHPDTPHKAMAMQKIDSIDWAQASSLNTSAAYEEYLSLHQDGDHYNEAEENLRQLRATEITEEEKSMVARVFRRFFISINEQDEAGVSSSVAEELTLLDKTGANRADAVQMMNKMYKENITHLLWRLNKDYSINKREIGTNQYEYSVNFTAQKEEQYIDAADNKTSQYRVSGKVNPEGLISELKLVKIVE